MNLWNVCFQLPCLTNLNSHQTSEEKKRKGFYFLKMPSLYMDNITIKILVITFKVLLNFTVSLQLS